MTTAAIAEIENLIRVQVGDEGDLQVDVVGGQSGDEELPPPPQAAAAEAGLEFCCKYCDKKFYNKQALGGHQNAHRMERAMEKNARRSSRGGFMDYGFLNGHFPGFPPFSGGHVNWYQDSLSRGQLAAVNSPYFLPGHPIPSPEIPTSPPYAYPFLPAVPENHSHYVQVSPPPPSAAMIVSGANTPPGVPVNSRVTPRPGSSIVINSNNPPRNNTPAEIIKDGELDLTLKL